MPATEFQGSSHHHHHHHHQCSRFSLKRHVTPAAVMDGAQALDLDTFHCHVTDAFSSLSSSSHELLSLPWLRDLLDSFLRIHHSFNLLLCHVSTPKSSPAVDRLLSDYFERSVKGLDVCNAVRDGIEQMRQWQKHLQIVLCALDRHRSLGEGQFRRAKKALIDLAISMLDDKDGSAGSNNYTAALAHRNRSFGRSNNPSGKDYRHFRSLSWSVSRSWSAARQLQAISNNLSPPKPNEITATGGLATAIFTVNSVLLFVMWALVAAIPCQDRGLQVHFNVPRTTFGWGVPLLSMHERIMEESKKRDRRNACALMKEIHKVEKCSRAISQLADSVQFPLGEEKEGDVRQRVQELAELCEGLKEGLDPLERQVREVFHGIVRSRTEGMNSLGKSNNE